MSQNQNIEDTPQIWAMVKPFILPFSALLIFAAFSASAAKAQLQIADSVTENFSPSLNLNFACGDDLGVTSDTDIGPFGGYCPLGNQPTYEISYNFDNPSLNEVFDSIVIWANSGNIYTDLELTEFDLNVDFLDVNGNPAVFTMNDVNIGDTLGPNDPLTLLFSDASGAPVTLNAVFSIRLSNLRNQFGSGGEVPWRELQANIVEVNILTSKTVETLGTLLGTELAVPGEDVQYTITVELMPGTVPDDDSYFLLDTLPEEVTFLGDAPVVIFSETGTNFSFDPATDLAFATGSLAPTSFADCTYTPVSTADPAVRFVCFNPRGNFDLNSGAGSFEFSFRVRID